MAKLLVTGRDGCMGSHIALARLDRCDGVPILGNLSIGNRVMKSSRSLIVAGAISVPEPIEQPSACHHSNGGRAVASFSAARRTEIITAPILGA